MMKKLKIYSFMMCFCLLFACSEKDNSQGGDHVWKDQTGTIDKASEVEGILKDSMEEKKKAIGELTE